MGVCAQVPAPAMTAVRYDEDYSYVSDASERVAWWENLKYVRFAESSAWHWSLGAEVRARYERYENDEWSDAPEADHDYVWWRALPYVEIGHADDVRIFGQLIAAIEVGDEADTGPTDEDRADILQAFAEVSLDPEWTLRAGRQVLAFGSERLISARYGPNVLRSFDAATFVVRPDAWTIDMLFGRPVRVDVGAFDDEADDSRSVWTLYGTRAFGEARGIDLYYIGYANESATFDQGSGREERHTLGSRVFGEADRWDWNFELFGQAGTFGDGDIRAWSAASDSGYTLHDVPLEPRIGLRANIISGDDDPDDADLETFNPLFPKGKYFGEAGLIGPSNLINLHPSLELALTEYWNVALASVFYWRESTHDGVYGNAGQLLRSDGGSDERYVGTQYDVSLGYAPIRVFDASFSYSVFSPGAFLSSTGSDETVQYVGLELRFRF